ncbi:MAG: anhydro-N-acetylmuramic acid kinase [Burkholderiales bacterium]|nr:anhydro-N-acetylmuramic acid kinase [Burkholderiales bacterium]
MPANSSLYIGLMSGTSLDGVDGVLASLPPDYQGGAVQALASAYVPFTQELRTELMALQTSGNDEIQREAHAANSLARCYANCIKDLLRQSGKTGGDIRAAGVHGQTIRHRPELGYTRQINNPALLAELSRIDIVADFRSRDIAAGGQGAPLVPAFHQAVFAKTEETRVVANIGGIANISILGEQITGFDTGPGNVLMDAWIGEHLDRPYDEQGNWAAGGKILPDLLQALRNETYFALLPPKSTGRDLFHMAWLKNKLAAFGQLDKEDVQATLAALTATTLADAIRVHAPAARAVFVCGGGAQNAHLMQQLRTALNERGLDIPVDLTSALGVAPNHVEALAFAWLAYRFDRRTPGNLPTVTGASGPRILGALYPA